jgi:L-ribulose-5-phosphate 3-epimerase
VTVSEPRCASLRLGYNSSGFARTADLHAVIDAVADIGFAGIELSLDARHHHCLHHDDAQAAAVGQRLRQRGLGVVVGTGARYVLGPVKHEPAFATPAAQERERYLAFMERAMDQAPLLGAEVVMLHSGYAPVGVEPDRAWAWLVQGSARLAAGAAERGLVLGFEFHPDMLVRTLADWERLAAAVDHPAFGLTLDIGHVACTEQPSIPEVIAACLPRVVNVHLEDIRGRVHEHLPIGEGDIDFAAVFEALRRGGYRGLVNAELNSDDLPVDECALASRTWQHLHAASPSADRG